MRHFKYTLVVALIACLTSAFAEAQPQSEAVVSARLGDAAQAWRTYRDDEYNITVEYLDEGWSATTTISQDYPFAAPNAIVKRVTFLGPTAGVDLDIWLAHGDDLETWLANYSITRSLNGTPFPALVAGCPASIYLDQESLSIALATFFSDGNYVYRWWYTSISNETDLEAYWHFLSSFRSAGCSGTTTQIPESLQEIAKQYATGQQMSPRNNCCCGKCSSYCIVPFPCCKENGVDKGNCTFGVCWKYESGGTWIPFRGDAGDWWGQVPDYHAWDRQTGSPPIGKRSIAAYVKGHQKYPNGHVSFVASYGGGGTVSVWYMGWCVNCGTTATITRGEPTGYIFLKYEPRAHSSAVSHSRSTVQPWHHIK